MIEVKAERKITDQTVRDWKDADSYKAPCEYVCLHDVVDNTLWEGEPWDLDDIQTYDDFYIVDEFYDGNGLCILTIKDSIIWESYKKESKFKVGDEVYIDKGNYLPRIFGKVKDIDGDRITIKSDDGCTYTPNISKVYLLNLDESYKKERYDPYFDADIDTSNFTPQTPVPLKSLKQGEYFTLKDIPQPKDSQVWVKGEYDKYDREWICYKFSDISSGKGMKGSKLVYTDFIF